MLIKIDKILTLMCVINIILACLFTEWLQVMAWVIGGMGYYRLGWLTKRRP